MIVFVDNEHEKGYDKPWGEKIQAARTWIKYRLEDISGEPCLIVRYNRVTPALLEELKVKAVLVSGSGTPITEYDEAELVGLRAVFREKRYPTFGFCGGFQLLAETLGAELAEIGPLAQGEAETEPVNFSPGMKKEFGYHPVQLTAAHPLLAKLSQQPVMRHAHSWEIKSLPEGFEAYASTDVTPIQMIIHQTLPIVGTQFHPEYYTDEHPAGRQLIENFFRYSAVI